MIKVSEHEVQEITFLGILFRSLLDINLKSSFPHNIHNIRIHKEEELVKSISIGFEILQEFKIKSKLIGNKKPVFIIAEVGINHNGSYQIAKKLVDVAKQAGADCVKFQTHITEKEMIKTNITPGKISKKTLWSIIKNCELTEKDESCSVIGVRTSKYKYFKGRDKTRKRVFLFDLENDPLEEKNIKEENPEIIEKMEVILEDFDKKSLPVEEQEELTNEETKKIEKELRKLGYI